MTAKTSSDSAYSPSRRQSITHPMQFGQKAEGVGVSCRLIQPCPIPNLPLMVVAVASFLECQEPHSPLTGLTSYLHNRSLGLCLTRTTHDKHKTNFCFSSANIAPIVVMPSDLNSYLASRYLVADPKPSSKKRKRKHGSAATGLLITDDDESGWGKMSALEDDDGQNGPTTVTGATAEFRKSKKSNWKTLDGGKDGTPKDDSAAADAILASVAAENDAARAADDEVPVLDDAEGVVKMSDGTHAGLQSAATVSAQLARRQREEREDFERNHKNVKEAETVYRDATGRRIDISMKRAEARRAAAEAQEKERLAQEALKGDVQLEEARRRRERLDDAKLMAFARTADDETMNAELKEKERWNDPMMQFMSEKRDKSNQGKSRNRRPVYKGAAPPNRYGIQPGYRWDGVDRGNGFEGDRFKALNRRERNKDLDYSWQMDE